MSVLKRFLFLILSICLLLTGCATNTVSNPANSKPRPEQPHLYWKEIEVEVIKVDKRHWYASTHHYQIDITVHSEEYGLTKTFNNYASGAFAVIPGWNSNKGDIIKAELYSWVMDSTGEVVKREINRILS